MTNAIVLAQRLQNSDPASTYCHKLRSVWAIRSKIRALLLDCYQDHHARLGRGYQCTRQFPLWVPNSEVSAIDAQGAADFWQRMSEEYPLHLEDLHWLAHAEPLAHSQFLPAMAFWMKTFNVKQTAVCRETGTTLSVYPALAWPGLVIVQKNATHNQ